MERVRAAASRRNLPSTLLRELGARSNTNPVVPAPSWSTSYNHRLKRRSDLFQDGSERMIESLSLIDAVMPDVVASRQQQAHNSKNAVVKAEPNNTNGDDAAHNFGQWALARPTHLDV